MPLEDPFEDPTLKIGINIALKGPVTYLVCVKSYSSRRQGVLLVTEYLVYLNNPSRRRTTVHHIGRLVRHPRSSLP